MRRGVAGIATVLLPLTLAACGSEDDSPAAEGPSVTPARLPQSDAPARIHPDDLVPDVTNPWFPLEPGTRWTYRETDEDGEVQQVVVTATSQTRTIANGAVARVVRDTVSQDGEVVEDTFDWYAQGADGTVWYLGEETAEFEDGELSTYEGSFEAGVDDALAGVIMPAVPTVGQTYRQEYYRSVAEDNGEVLALDATAEVPAGSYEDLLQTADTNGLEPDVLEHKFYARGVGLVLTVDVESGAREELLSVTTVPAAAARRAATAPLGVRY
jgi:hypothetical protein